MYPAVIKNFCVLQWRVLLPYSEKQIAGWYQDTIFRCLAVRLGYLLLSYCPLIMLSFQLSGYLSLIVTFHAIRGDDLDSPYLHNTANRTGCKIRWNQTASQSVASTFQKRCDISGTLAEVRS